MYIFFDAIKWEVTKKQLEMILVPVLIIFLLRLLSGLTYAF